MRYTECRLAPLAMEMLRDIDKETVDFRPNYDGRGSEPVVLPSRFPNLLVNGSEGIAVGMATKIPPHNLREVAAGVQWYLENFDAGDEELLDALMERVKGPDFPTSGLIVGRRGIQEAYRTGRGSITMRAVVDVDEDARGRACLIVTELPFQVNPDNLALKIAELVKDGRVNGIADVRDESSDRAGQRLVIVLKRDAIAKVVLNNLYKHTQLQDTFGANMLALVDGVPRTLRLDQMIRYWVRHQIEVIVRRTRFLLRKAQERAHIVRALLKAIDAIDEVIALIRASASAAAAQQGLMELLDIDEEQARAILDMQLRKLAALERQQLVDEYDELMARIAEYEAILASPERQRQIVGDELGEIVARYGDDRRTRIIAYRRRRDGRGPHRRGGCGRHHHPRRLRQAHQDRSVPGAAAGRQGSARGTVAHRRHRRPFLRHHHPPLDPVLHQQGARLPGQGLRAARHGAGRAGPACGEPARLPA